MADSEDSAGLPASPDDLLDDEGTQLVLGDLLNRVLDKGVVISGHVTISVADIDLIALDLRLLISSIQTALERVAAAQFTTPRSPKHADVSLLPTQPRERR